MAVAVEPHGRDLLVINRTITWADDGLSQINADALTPPAEAKATAMPAALDHLGYTGPRKPGCCSQSTGPNLPGPSRALTGKQQAKTGTETRQVSGNESREELAEKARSEGG